MYLIKAEALNEQGQTAAAIVQANLIRSRHFATPNPIPVGSQAAARTAILNERLFELAGEGKRRQDLIRAGTYTDAHPICSSPIASCTKAAAGPYRILFPIPETQLQSNSLLVQNAGY